MLPSSAFRNTCTFGRARSPHLPPVIDPTNRDKLPKLYPTLLSRNDISL
jgi:hypothetical protein